MLPCTRTSTSRRLRLYRTLVARGFALGVALGVVLPLAALSVAAADAVPVVQGPASIGGAAGGGGTVLAARSDAMHCARPAQRAHFKKKRAVVAVAVGMAESYCRKDAVGHNPPTSGCPDGSDDRGLWQINSCYHSEVSDHCAFNPTCNARAAKRISDRGRDWTPWSAFNNGAYRQYLRVAKHAVDRAWG